ncbi:hypothetical protein ACFXHA_25840 [Nocardia sp. NPDC059240]|uniref:hypothetical protein n=1 Tax=Nocardia sp. NPDC059240 TaxID=3346786 RepID=UPI00367B3ABE
MKIALGTVGLLAAGLFLTAPAANADVTLQPIDVGITGSGTGSGTGNCGSGPAAELGLGSVGVGSSVGGPYIDFGSVCVPLLG